MTVAVHGSYYGYNFGDTLLCRMFSDWTRSAVSDEDVVLPLASSRNRHLIGGTSRGVTAALQARKFLFVGGGYFSEPETNKRPWSRRAYWRHVWLAEAAYALGRPYAVLGVGAGPISEPWLAERVSRVFERAERVIVRDSESAEFLRSIGVSRDVSVWVDAAISLPKLPSTAPNRRPTLLVHINVNPSEAELAVAETAARWGLKNPGVDVVLIEDGAPRLRRTPPWARQLIQRLERPARLTYRPYDGNPATLLETIRQSHAVVTTKLHMGIVASTQHKYVVSFPVHSKTQRFYNQIGLPRQCMPIAEGAGTALGLALDRWAGGEHLDFSGLEALRQKSDYADAVRTFVSR